MNNPSTTKPCLVETRQGFSVFYQNKPLYSKYAPKDSILKVIDNLQILPNTLILCFSPVLGYGLQELLNKAPEDSFILALEKDKNLYDFSLNCTESLLPPILENSHKVFYANPETSLQIAKLVNNIKENTPFSHISFPKIANFKRVLPLDFSGGAKIHTDFYQEVTSLLDDSISQFWKNRTTLIKLGRLYAGNFFKNLQDIRKTQFQNLFSLTEVKKLVANKQILVLATGLSLDDFLPVLKSKLLNTNLREHLFIIAVDATLPVITKYDIKPDLVVGVEGQFAIEKAYIGFKDSKLSFASDLLSRPSIKRILKGKTSFFLSKYTSEAFFEVFSQLAQQLDIPRIEPLGSVGLVAVELALQVRNSQQKIFCCGTDFSFFPGKTHSKGAPVHSAILANNFKLSSTEQFGSSFNSGNFYITGKSSYQNPENQELTSKALYNYALHFTNRYSKIQNVFDLGKFGIETNLPKCDYADFFNLLNKTPYQIFSTPSSINSQQEQVILEKIISDFLSSQHNNLLEIKDILTGKKDATNLEQLLQKCGYLYLHFPDGHTGPKLSSDFLKRIRAEVEFFLKITKL